MEKSIVQCDVLNSELNIPKEMRVFLTYPVDGLTPCSIEEKEDGICFTFVTDELEPCRIIYKKSKEEQLRFLINCAELEDIFTEYSFSLSPENLMLDINLCPHVLKRDKQCGNTDFLSIYMALIGNIVLSKYSYDNFIIGGKDLYKKNKLLKELNELESVSDIKTRLIEEYQRVIEKNKVTKRLVPKRNVIFSRIIIPVLFLLLCVTSFLAIRSVMFDVPYRDTLLAANTAYIARDHLSVQRELSEIMLDDMDVDTKYILARSYVVTEPLTDAQRTNVLQGITRLTAPEIFDYWIMLGRLDAVNAIDLAQRLGDNELLLFALLKYEAIIQADTTMSGEEKVTLLSSLERQIDELQKSREEMAESIDDEAELIH